MVTSEELEMYEAPSSSVSFDLFGERPSHHHTPNDFEPAFARSTAQDLFAYAA
jgi:hypothetical protein